MASPKVAAWFDLITGKRLTQPTSSIDQLIRDDPYRGGSGLARHGGRIVEGRIRIKGPGRPDWPNDEWRELTPPEVAQLRRARANFNARASTR